MLQNNQTWVPQLLSLARESEHLNCESPCAAATEVCMLRDYALQHEGISVRSLHITAKSSPTLIAATRENPV